MKHRPRILRADLAGTLAWLGVDLTSDRTNCYAPTNISRHSTGYYHIQFAGRKTLLHRLIAEHKRGRPLDSDAVARHDCGHSWCVNPAHIVDGTPAENMADQYRHGTRVMGERHPQCRLTDEQVVEIMGLLAAGGLSESAVAARYGVSRHTVNDFRHGRRRRALTAV